MKNKELDLFKDLLPAIDNNIKSMYDAGTDVGRKDIKGKLWNLNRYVSSVKGNYDLQAFSVLKVNEYYNKNWNVLGGTNHNKLQWQLLCVAGNKGSAKFHPWIGLKKKKDSSSKAVKFLYELYPNMKLDEAELLAKISTKKELKQLARDHNIDNASF